MSVPQPIKKSDLFTPVVPPQPVNTLLGGSISPMADEERNPTQLALAPPNLRGLPVVELCLTKGSTTSSAGLTQPLCSLNLLIALEWVPSVETMAALKSALLEASRLLFDVTDGYVAIGQVLIGHTELMGCADIQIFASNRLFPRSAVNAMTDPAKYRPIRLGRGLWDKNNRVSIGWSTRSGFATIVHELGHHALGLKDQYLGFTTNGLVVPKQSLVKDTIMASLESSELLAPRTPRGDQDPDSEWEALRQHPRFRSLGISLNYHKKSAPPSALLPQIEFFSTPAINQVAAELLLVLDPTNVSDGVTTIDLNYCWVYLARVDGAEHLTALIPQGSFEARPDGFRLLGAMSGDRVLLCGSALGKPGTPLNLWATIHGAAGITATLDQWQSATLNPWPSINVAPTGITPTGPYSLAFSPPALTGLSAQIFPTGAAGPRPAAAAAGLAELDGHVVISHAASPWKLAIASYSLGGSPASAYPAHPNPIPAGSPDGNAMIFFFHDVNRPNYASLYGSRHTPEEYQIVTTTNYHDHALPPTNAKPRSYAFSIASNLPMGDLSTYRPTLVLYYDKQTRDESSDTLVICRYNSSTNQWDEIAACEDLIESFLVAAPLNITNAPGLYQSQPEPECYRLFLKPTPAGGGSQPSAEASV